MGRMCYVGISAVLCLVGLLGIILLCATSKDSHVVSPFQYGIVIDAGSSRTTLFIYIWPASTQNNTGIVSQHSSCRVAKGGISSYASNAAGAGNSLKQCLDKAVDDIPAKQHRKTPLYLGATAGMRLLNLRDSNASKEVLNSVTATMRSYHFDFRGAKVLTGQEEGLFGWVTVNYLLENFIKYNWLGQWIKPRRATVGAMDFGGASTQLTFESKEWIENLNSSMVLRLYGHEYKVYTHSYLCYGRDQVMKKVISKMLKKQGYKDRVTNPCLPRGYGANHTLGFIYNSPCTAGERPADMTDDSTTVNFIGSSNPAECKSYVQEIFDFESCSFSNCSFNGVYQPQVTGNFMAFSAFYYTINFLKTALKKDITTPRDLEEAATTICRDSLHQLSGKAPNVEKTRLVDYCTTSFYIHILMSKGYKFNEDSFKNISFQQKADDTEIGWALGYMLNLTNLLPAEHVYLHKSQLLEAWAVLIVLFVVVLVMGITISAMSLRSTKDNTVL